MVVRNYCGFHYQDRTLERIKMTRRSQKVEHKKTYIAPKMFVYGNLRSLTLAKAGAAADGGSGQTMA
jgi:hypothetical protein